MRTGPELTLEESDGHIKALVLVRRQDGPNSQFIGRGTTTAEALRSLAMVIRLAPNGGEELAVMVEEYARTASGERRRR